MSVWLGARDACFELGVQRQNDPASMPIEDPTVLWDEAKSPFVTVADIVIPAQTFNRPAQGILREPFVDAVARSPEHQPVGGSNRVRRAVYQAISTMLHQLNGAARVEPTRMKAFN